MFEMIKIKQRFCVIEESFFFAVLVNMPSERKTRSGCEIIQIFILSVRSFNVLF